jgi:predicted nucleic acid-binding protein
LILLDVNILVYAHRDDAGDHEKYRRWLEETMDSGDGFGISELVLSAFVRIVTHSRIYPDPTPVERALDLQVNCGSTIPASLFLRASGTGRFLTVCAGWQVQKVLS